jgi:hypothetical protein
MSSHIRGIHQDAPDGRQLLVGSEQLKQPLQRTVFEPATIPVVNRIPFPKFPGQIPSGNPRSRQVEQGLQEIAVGNLCGSASFFYLRLGQTFLETAHISSVIM